MDMAEQAFELGMVAALNAAVAERNRYRAELELALHEKAKAVAEVAELRAEVALLREAALADEPGLAGEDDEPLVSRCRPVRRGGPDGRAI